MKKLNAQNRTAHLQTHACADDRDGGVCLYEALAAIEPHLVEAVKKVEATLTEKYAETVPAATEPDAGLGLALTILVMRALERGKSPASVMHIVNEAIDSRLKLEASVDPEFRKELSTTINQSIEEILAQAFGQSTTTTPEQDLMSIPADKLPVC